MRNLSAWKHRPDNLHRNVLCEQLLQTPYYMVEVSMEASLSGQAGFGISNTVCPFWRKWAWPVRPLTWSWSTRLLNFGLRPKQGMRNTSCQHRRLTRIQKSL